jgi:predicted transcriptional regulator
MPTSLRLKPDIERLLDQACRRTHKTRSALIHEALSEYLKPRQPRLGDLIRAALKDSPEGFGLERGQPDEADKRDWRR